jgi:hypothetical protein
MPSLPACFGRGKTEQSQKDAGGLVGLSAKVDLQHHVTCRKGCHHTLRLRVGGWGQGRRVQHSQ